MIFLDNYYLFFALLATGIIFIAGTLLLIFSKREERAKKMLGAYLPWLVMAPLFFLIVGLGKIPLLAALFLLSIFCAKEFAKAMDLKGVFLWTLYLAIGGSYVIVWQGYFELLNLLPLLVALVFFIIPVLRNTYHQMLYQAAVSIVGLIFFGWAIPHLGFLSQDKTVYLLYLAMGIVLNDASAYIFGNLFGKRPLLSQISPKKTVEGALGALVVVILYSLIASPWLALSGYWLALSTLLIWLGGSLGDLTISLIKRDIGIKDMGACIPHHGGVLDRADSLIIVSPLYFHLLKLSGVLL